MISGVIITYNEEDHISACVSSLRGIVKEIIVIDSESTDNTVSLAKNAGAKVYSQSWRGYGASRNIGAVLAEHDWILSLDADERCTEEMKTSISNQSLFRNHVYLFKRRNIYNRKVMKYGLLRPEWKARLYNRSRVSWNERMVHENLHSDDVIIAKKLKGEIIHYAFKDQEHMIKKLDHYARLTAIEWHNTGYVPHMMIERIGPYFHFLKSYFLKLGFLEGAYGLQTSKATYVYSQKKYVYYRRGV